MLASCNVRATKWHVGFSFTRTHRMAKLKRLKNIIGAVDLLLATDDEKRRRVQSAERACRPTSVGASQDFPVQTVVQLHPQTAPIH